MADFNPYAPPQVDSTGDNGRTIEVSFVADEPLIVDTAAEEKRKRYWAVTRVFVPVGIVVAIGLIIVAVSFVPPRSVELSINIGQFALMGCVVVGTLFYYIIDKAIWRSLQSEAAHEISDLQRSQPVFQYGTWHVRLEAQQVVLITPGGEISWPLENLRRLDIRTHRHRVNAALFLQTPELVLPIPRTLKSAEPFENLAALAKARIAGEP